MRALILIAGLAGIAHAEDLPQFNKGKWQFERTVQNGAGKPQTLSSSKCASPSEDMKMRSEGAAKAGCKVTPVAKSGSSYTYSATCPIGGKPVESTSVMTVESASAYRVSVESKSGGKVSKEVLVAKRVGDC
jgi:hypothetical protein